MATVARAIHSDIPFSKTGANSKRESVGPASVLVPVQRPKVGEAETGKIVLQPRLCTLRSFGSDRDGVLRVKTDNVTPFFETLSDYIESSKKSHDFEIISGRLAMIVFAATVGTEFVTGNSLFGKMDLQGIAEAAAVCIGAMISAAAFAYRVLETELVESLRSVVTRSSSR